MRFLTAVFLLLLCFAFPAAAERATLIPVPEAKKYLVPAAQLMRVDEGVFEVPVGGTIDLTDRKILLSVTSFTSGREKKCCIIMLNGDRIPWRTVGHRFDLKQLRATRQSLDDKNQCFLDIVDVATPKECALAAHLPPLLPLSHSRDRTMFIGWMDAVTKKLTGRYCAANSTRGALPAGRLPSGGAMMMPIAPSRRWSGFCRSARASTRPCPWRWFRHGLGGTWSALDRHRCVSVVQHGWAHANHARAAAEGGACEVGLHRGRKAILGDLRKGHDVLEDAFAGYFQPVVTPPWNRIDPALFPDLALMGYRGISTFDARNDEPAAAGLVAQNCHCDPIDWEAGTPRHEALIGSAHRSPG